VPSLDEALSLLFQNRYDVFTGGTRTAGFNIGRLGYREGITRIPAILDTTTVHLCIGKKSSMAHLLEPFGAAIKKMKKNGRLQEIHDEYEYEHIPSP